MTGIINRTVLVATLSAMSAYAGALTLEISNPDTNSEAKGLNATLVAQVTACHEPAKSTLTATLIESNSGAMQRVALQVVPLKTAGTFAIIGALPRASVIDLTVTNPEFRNYQPHMLIRSDEHGMQWTRVKRYFSKPPTDADVKALLD